MGKNSAALVVRVLAMAVVAASLIAADCSSAATPTITVTEQRNGRGVLDSVTVKGTGFTANGSVRFSYFVQPLSGGLIPVEAMMSNASSGGTFTIEVPRRCPNFEGVEVTRGKFTSMIANDLGSGKSGVADLHPGRESDCVRL